MNKWREVKLGELGKVIAGGTPSTKTDEYWNGSIGWVTPRDLSNYNSKYISNGERNITDRGLKESSAKLMPKGSILMTSRAPIGYLAIANNDISTNQGFKNIVCNEELVNNEFLYYYLKSNMEYIKLFSSGATFPEISGKKFKNIKIQIPDLKTQEKIADLLSTYDELIENNNRRIEILEKTAEEIYKEWFVRMRFPGHENTKFIKGIPEGWEVKRVGDLAKFKRGKNLVIRDAIPGGVPVIAGGMTPSCYHNEANTNAPVITVSASGANAGYTQLNHVNVWASDCSYIDINDTDLVYYIYLLLKVSHKEILNLQLGSAQPHVYARDLNKFKFLKPEMRLIKIINNYAKDIFEEIKYLSSINQNLIKQRDLLLPRLMNGTIEVK